MKRILTSNRKKILLALVTMVLILMNYDNLQKTAQFKNPHSEVQEVDVRYLMIERQNTIVDTCQRAKKVRTQLKDKFLKICPNFK